MRKLQSDRSSGVLGVYAGIPTSGVFFDSVYPRIPPNTPLVTSDDKFMGSGCSKRVKRTEVIEENREWFGISGRRWRTIDIED